MNSNKIHSGWTVCMYMNCRAIPKQLGGKGGTKPAPWFNSGTMTLQLPIHGAWHNTLGITARLRQGVISSRTERSLIKRVTVNDARREKHAALSGEAQDGARVEAPCMSNTRHRTAVCWSRSWHKAPLTFLSSMDKHMCCGPK